MNDLVQKLATGDHPVTVGDPQPSHEDFQKRVTDMGYVFLKFTDTQGGTNLGIRIDPTATDLSLADFVRCQGMVHIEGSLTLNYVHVRCIADIDLTSLTGTGHLVVLEEVSLPL